MRRLRPRRLTVNVESLGESGSEDGHEIVNERRRDPGCPKPLFCCRPGWRTDVGVSDADIVDQARQGKPCGNGYANDEDNTRGRTRKLCFKVLFGFCSGGKLQDN